MKILHTSDWHLGKYLENRSRIDEQIEFIEELDEIAEEEKIDIIIISGDVYDTINPPAFAERLFFKSMKKLTKGGKRIVLVIAGNHDSPERLTASSTLLIELGIILIGTPKTVVPIGEYENFSIVDSGEGFIEFLKNGEKAVILTMPYPSEKRLNEIISENDTEQVAQKAYSEKIGEIFKNLESKFREDTINIAVGHFYVIGGETSKSERDITLGGSYAVNGEHLPNAQYIAMGHLHRPQKISCNCKNAYYSGSPIQYSKSEANYPKCVYIVHIKAGEEPVVIKKYLRNYKPIEIWQMKNVEQALEKCRQTVDDNSWVFMEIETDKPLLQCDIKEMRRLRKDIIEIYPKLLIENIEANVEVMKEKTLSEEFLDFYLSERKLNAIEDTLKIFLEICGKEELL